MKKYREILIGLADGDHVSIHVNSDWLDAEIEVSCDGWTGRAKTKFHRGELGLFAKEIHRLHRKLSGTAGLSPREPNLELVLTGDGKGHIHVEGFAQNHFERMTKLNFQFEIDQTYLKQIADALNEVDPAV